MKQYTFVENGFTFERINKKQARRAYNNGLTVRFCPCNIRPDFPLGLGMDMNRIQQNCEGVAFDVLLNQFEWYNCNTETGKYTAFYIPVIIIDSFTGEQPTSSTVNTNKQYDYKYMEV